MLDERTRMMLEVANALTADDLELVKSGQFIVPNSAPATAYASESKHTDTVAATPQAKAGLARGEYERQRSRQSKVSTDCLGTARSGHDWWPVGTELIGTIGSEVFTAQVVENPRVKSGKSVRITSGPAQGKICNTPTRAALEATEAYRQANGLGRGGGVTNGWTFWKPRST